ncbi:MAG: cyclic nucleotide-binding domain-containing protein, partial [Myxococcota bacterium]
EGAEAALADERDALDAGEAPRRRRSEDLAKLPAMPFFAELPKPALGMLLADATLVEAAAGERWIAAGDAADALFVIVEGDAEVHVAGRPRPLALGEGDIVGESCLLDDVVRRADVNARSAMTALRIPKASVDAVVDAYPDVRHRVQELLTRRLLANLLHTSPLFAAFDPGSRKELARRFEVRAADAGTVLVEAGKRSDAVYTLMLGSLNRGGSAMRPGDTFGQRSIIDHSPAEHTVVASTEALLLRLPRAKFSELAALYPPVIAALSEL